MRRQADRSKKEKTRKKEKRQGEKKIRQFVEDTGIKESEGERNDTYATGYVDYLHGVR